ncbi:MAG: VOC family protein [Acidobacteria bacterium]|nr:MAG: VOC family protein [Acidobacteriota bacterium]REK05369.1 MAG: VOC family protein [Acidobacteriota bacterium]
MHRIGHLEIAAVDGAALERFYGELFGWRVRRAGGGEFTYGWVHAGDAVAPPQPDAAGPSITVGFRHEPQGSAEVVFYVGVDDVKATAARAEELGATVRIPPMDGGGGMFFALLADPEGNPFGITQQRAEQSDEGGDS